jgi:hypothetical protein
VPPQLTARKPRHPKFGDRRIAIPAQIFFDDRLLTERITTPHVYSALVAAEESREGKATYGQVADWLGMSHSAIGHHLRWLRDYGYLDAEEGQIRMSHRIAVKRFPPPLP